eukprot:244158-Prymnesium_polylepis.1
MRAVGAAGRGGARPANPIGRRQRIRARRATSSKIRLLKGRHYEIVRNRPNRSKTLHTPETAANSHSKDSCATAHNEL